MSRKPKFKMCPECGARMWDDYSSTRLDTGVVKKALMSRDGLVLEHASPNGERFHSERSLREYCKKNNLASGALL